MTTRIFLTLIAYLLSLILVAATTFVVVMFLAGPHAGIFPSWFEAVILCLGWLCVITLPMVVAYKVWKSKKSAVN